MKISRLIIGGDIVPTESNFELFSSVKVAELFGDDLLNIFEQADFRVFNLEVPLADRKSPIMKCGPNLIAPTSTARGIKGIQADLLALANNHILDQGEPGLFSTLKVLEENEIYFVGAGSNLQEAAQPFLVDMNRIRIGIYACAEHEFSLASDSSAGANPFDPLESLDHIADLKNKCDYVIVLYHGGKEHYRYPSPDLQRICRKLVDKGADLVVCQHSHCIGAFESWHSGTIVYGQGNLLFDRSENEFWQTSLLIEVTLTGENMSLEYIPIVKCGNTARLANKQQSGEILESFNERSRQILEAGFIHTEYDKFAANMLNTYLTAFWGDNLMFKVMNRLCGYRIPARMHSNQSLTWLRNFVECEAHRELIIAGLKAEQEKGV